MKLKGRKAKTMPNMKATSLPHLKPMRLLGEKNKALCQLCGSGLDTAKATRSRQSQWYMPVVDTNQDSKQIF